MRPNRLVLYLKILAVLFVALLIYGLYQLETSGTLEVDIAPLSGQIRLDNKVIKPGKHRVHTGNYKLTFSRSGFSGISQNISVSRGSYQYRAEALVPSDPSLASWYVEHPSDQKKAEAISSKFFDTNMQTQLKNLPILKQLPYVNLTPYFKIDYGVSKKYPNDPDKIAFYIYANSDAARQAALAWMKQNGANPSKLEIVYPNFIK